MFAWMIAHFIGSSSTVFPELPIEREVSAGRKIYLKGAGIDRTLMADRITLGTWFDGRVRRAVDTATWVRPELVARWFGYMAERDGWGEDAVRRRWKIARLQLQDSVTFIVRLAAFPRLDPFEFDIGAPPRPNTLRGVRFRLAFNPSIGWKARIVQSASGSCTAMFEKEAPNDVSSRSFFSQTPLAPLFLDDGELDPPDDGIRLGDYYGAVYVVTFLVAPDMAEVRQFDLTVQLPSKREIAHFMTTTVPVEHPEGDIDDE